MVYKFITYTLINTYLTKNLLTTYYKKEPPDVETTGACYWRKPTNLLFNILWYYITC